jgi:predicted  nucleic acid-binding Zn-ribbon protein
MPPYKIKESFRWLSPEFTYNDAPGDKVIIKGTALFSAEKFFDQGVSKNMRRYVQDELLRSARTLKGAYIDVNHEMSQWEETGKRGRKPTLKGHVLFGEEEEGTIEYVAEVNHHEYAQKIRDTDKVRNGTLSEEAYTNKWGVKPLLGVSVDATFNHLQCKVCGQKFYDPKKFEAHMINEELIKNFKWEPRQIAFKGLSIVEPPEQPGVSGANFEIVETSQEGFSQLLETVIKTAKEKETMKDTTEKKGVPYRIKEQEEPPPEPEKDEHGCKIGQEEWDGTKCVPIKKEEPTATEQATPAPNTGEQSEGEPEKLACPEGFHLVTDDQGNQTCEPDLPPPPMDNPTATEQADANPVQPAVSTQVAPQSTDGAVVTVTDTPPPCPTGQHRDPDTGLCVADKAVVEPAPNTAAVTVETIRLPTKLPRLDEACNWKAKGFSSGDSCVTKMQGKVDDPEAFCYAEATETAAHETLNIYEAQTDLRKELNSTTAKQRGTNTKFTEAINTLTEAAAIQHKQSVNVLNHVNAIAEKTLSNTKKLIRNVESAANHNLLAETKKLQASTSSLQSQIKEVTATSTKNHEQLQSQIIEATEAATKSLKQLQEYTTAQIGKLATSTARELQTLRKVNPQTTKEIQQLRHEITETKKLATEQKKDFETILATADKTVEDLQGQVKSLEEWKATQEQQLTETQKKAEDKKTQQDTIKEALEPLQTQISNLEAKIHGDFKQTHKTSQTDEESTEASDQLPYDQK